MVFAGQSVDDKGFIQKNETQMKVATAERFFKAAVRNTHKLNMHRGKKKGTKGFSVIHPSP